MTTLREAAQQALEALEKLVVGSEYEEAVEAERAMDALRAALAEPMEPVNKTPAWWMDGLTATLMREGYRKCAEEQRTTQFCGLLDAAVKAEREACAKVCEDLEDRENPYERNVAVLDCASAIRARGE